MAIIAALVAPTFVLGEVEEVRRAEVARPGAAVDAAGAEDGGTDEGLWGDGGKGLVEAAMAESDASQVGLAGAKRIRLSLEAGVIADDNIFLRGTDPVSDVMYRGAADVELAFGDSVARAGSYLVVNYRPEAFFFERNSAENSVDHDVAMAGQRRLTKLALAATGRYQRTSGSTVDLGDRVERDVFEVGAGLTYDWTSKTRAAASFGWNETKYLEAGYSDHAEWVGELFVDSGIGEKLRFGLGGGGGQLRVSGGAERQDFERVLVRAAYAPTAKLSFRGRGGVEFRRTGAGSGATPVFGLDADYAVAAKTALRVRAGREVLASGSLEDQNYERTGVSLGLTHRVNDRIELGLDGGWERYKYRATERDVDDLGRRDDSAFVRPSFTYTLAERWSAEAWFQWRSNDSNDPDQDYDVNQGGLSLRYEFR